MKKHIDWYRVWWVIYLVGGSALSVLCLYYFYAQNWTQLGWVLNNGIVEKVIEPATFSSWAFSILVGLFTTIIIGHLLFYIPSIIKFFYHNGE